jgi:hypothetical protein
MERGIINGITYCRFHPAIERFANFVAAAEREACLEAVKRAKEHQIFWYPKGSTINANDIGDIYAFQHERCVDAIRARGESE